MNAAPGPGNENTIPQGADSAGKAPPLPFQSSMNNSINEGNKYINQSEFQPPNTSTQDDQFIKDFVVAGGDPQIKEKMIKP